MSVRPTCRVEGVQGGARQHNQSYGLIVWGNSTDSDDIFKTQKRIIRIITNSNKDASCRELFKKLNILPLQSQYIYSILLFIIKNKDQFPLNSHTHTINTRHNNNLHVPPANLTVYQSGVYYSTNNHKKFIWQWEEIPNCTKKLPLVHLILQSGGIL